MTAPESSWPPVTAADVDPVQVWLSRARCCGAPQLCGARCMDDAVSQTEAAVVRRLDEAEAAVARVAAVLGELDGGSSVGVIRRELADRLRAALSGEVTA